MGFFKDARIRVARDKQAIEDWFQICENFYREFSRATQRMYDLKKMFYENSDIQIRTQIIEEFERHLQEIQEKENFFKSNEEFSKNFMVFGMKAKASKDHMLKLFESRIPHCKQMIAELKAN